jgi:hypothetical protein
MAFAPEIPQAHGLPTRSRRNRVISINDITAALLGASSNEIAAKRGEWNSSGDRRNPQNIGSDTPVRSLEDDECLDAGRTEFDWGTARLLSYFAAASATDILLKEVFR